MTARNAYNAPDGLRVARVEKLTLQRSIVDRLATALRDGVPAHKIDGLQAIRNVQQLQFIEANQSRVDSLKSQIQEAARRASVQLQLIEDCQTAEEARVVREIARKHLATKSQLESELKSLENAKDDGELERHFTGEVDYLLAGLTALADPSAVVSADAAHAVRTVLRDFQIDVTESEAHWSVKLLIPYDDGVAELGPITGAVPLKGTPTPVAYRKLAPKAGTRARNRQRARESLRKAGYSQLAADVAAMAPQRQLVRTLLNESVGWTDVPERFDADAFNEHLRHTYAHLRDWGRTRYLVTTKSRQAIINAITKQGGTVTLHEAKQIAKTVGISRSSLDAMLDGRKSGSGRLLPPFLKREGRWTTHPNTSKTAYVSCIRCPLCDEPATAVVMVPEVPGALLCRSCCVPPAQPNLVFPRIYVDLALSSE